MGMKVRGFKEREGWKWKGVDMKVWGFKKGGYHY